MEKRGIVDGEQEPEPPETEKKAGDGVKSAGCGTDTLSLMAEAGNSAPPRGQDGQRHTQQ